MNFRYVFCQLGLLFVVLSLILLLMAGGFFGSHLFIEAYEVEPTARTALILSGALGLVVGGLMWLLTRRAPKQLGRREALFLVAMSWVIGSAFTGLPYYLWATMHPTLDSAHSFHSFTDCYFEAMSGLTTTGATILTDIDAIPHSLLLWRALTHWLGGLGIVVLFVAVLPQLGVGAKKLFRAEIPGPTKKGFTPQIRETAKVLAWIYLGITAASILALRATGAMGWFDAICHTFSMVSTGGLSTRDASIAAFDSVAVDIICMFFMLTAGVNFAVFYMFIRGQWRRAIADREFRVYVLLKVICIVLVMISVASLPTITTTTGETVENTPLQNARYSAFQTIALHTGTGFCTADYDPWPFFARTILIGLMFIGGSAGSTAGGIKVIRFWMVLKIIFTSFEKSFRPQVVRPVRVGESVMDDEAKLSAMIYVVGFMLLFLIGAVAVRLLELDNPPCDFATAMSASLSTIGNIGPGLHGVGPTQTYAWFSAPSKWIFCLLMLLGRLEIFTILVILTPRFWRAN